MRTTFAVLFSCLLLSVGIVVGPASAGEYNGGYGGGYNGRYNGGYDGGYDGGYNGGYNGRYYRGGMSRFLLNIAKRSLPRLTLRGAGLASKNALC
jgi:hypothetical protein